MTAPVDPLVALALWLVEQGVGVYRPDGPPYADDEVALTVGYLPANPPQLVALTAYAGPELTTRYDEVPVQLRVRGTADERVSRYRSQGLHDLLHGLQWARMGDLVTSVFAAQSGPVPLGVDANGRHEHAVNIRMEFRNPGRGGAWASP